MASDTSLVFNLVARDRASAALNRMRGKFEAASTAIGAGVAAALGVGLAEAMDVSAASDKLAAQLGVGPAEAAALSKVSAKVYQSAWGESTTQVNDAIRGVYQNIGNTDTANGGVERLTTKTLALAEAFDQDVNMATAAVGQMMKTGMAKNADEAFDIITRGFQTGVNKSDDFLETLNEYGTKFRDLGISGQMATGLLSQGLKAGARDADLVADAIKEFSIRAIDGSKATAEGFTAIGLNAGDMSRKIGAGGKTASDALDLTLDKLRAMEDPVARDAAAVALFGTQAEDLGDSLFALDPSAAVGALGQVKGAAEDMSTTLADNPAAALEEFKRKAVGKLSEIAGTIAQWAMDNQGLVKGIALAFGGLAAAIALAKVGMMAYNAYQTIVRAATATWTAIQWALNTALLANPITWIVIAIVALIAIIVLVATKTQFFQTVWKTVWGAIKTVFSAVWNWIKGVFNNLKTWFTVTLPNAARAVWNAIKAAWNGIKAGVKAVWDWLKTNVFDRIKTFFTSTIPNAANTVKTRVVTAWTNIKDKMRSLISNAVGFVRDKINSLVSFFRGLPGRISSAVSGLFNGIKNAFKSAINWVIGKWNGLSFTLPSISVFGKKIGGGTISTPNIPMLAKGGVVRGGGSVIVGEEGPEMLSLPKGAAVNPLSRSGGGGGGTAHVTFEFKKTGSALMDKFLEELQDAIRVRGGDVQTVIGYK